MALPLKTLGPAPLMAGFILHDVAVSDAITIRAATAGHGPPLLLLHGHPQTHVTWRKIAPRLAAHFTVVACDLRGYGDSSKPDGGANHIDHAKREMAADQVAVMRAFGFARFALAGHDRGGRVAHRMALDHPDAVSRLAVLDIAPTATMYALTDKAFATRYFWWFFLIQPAPLPERLIAADPAFFLRTHIDGQLKIAGATEPAAFAEYLRCYDDPKAIHAVCEDYRAAATIDLEHDAADATARIKAPLLALWGSKGTVGALYDVLQTWRDKAVNVRGRRSIAAMPCRKSYPMTPLRNSCSSSRAPIEAIVSERLDPRAQLHFERPGVARLTQDIEVGLRNAVWRQRAVRPVRGAGRRSLRTRRRR